MNELTLPALVTRVAHGTQHMRTADLVWRLATLAVGITGTGYLVATEQTPFAVITAVMTVLVTVVTALELYAVAVICDRGADEVEDQDDDEFGTAA